MRLSHDRFRAASGHAALIAVACGVTLSALSTLRPEAAPK